MKITIAPQDVIDMFVFETDKILSALDIKSAILTDETQLSDFLVYIDHSDSQVDAYNQKRLKAMQELFGREVAPNEYMWALAKELALKEAASLPPTKH